MDSPVVDRLYISTCLYYFVTLIKFVGRLVRSVRFGSQSDNRGISYTEDSPSPRITTQLVDVQFDGASDIETGSSSTSSEPQLHAEGVGGDRSSPSEGKMLQFFRFLATIGKKGLRWLSWLSWSHSTPFEEVIKMAKINLLLGIGLYSTNFSTVFTFPSIPFSLYVILATLGTLFSYIVIHAGRRLQEPISQALLDASTVTLLAALLMIPAMALQKLMVK